MAMTGSKMWTGAIEWDRCAHFQERGHECQMNFSAYKPSFIGKSVSQKKTASRGNVIKPFSKEMFSVVDSNMVVGVRGNIYSAAA